MISANLDLRKGGGLIPAIIQDEQTKAILMLGYMNEESLGRSVSTGFVCFWSRSRKKLWMKGEESGNTLRIKRIFVDCDEDTLLISVELSGISACHTGKYSCFFTELREDSL
ncbi:MAG: phosphoribosyl-AMP cyclohydrolase [Candidatus Woesebacteria bacterium]